MRTLYLRNVPDTVAEQLERLAVRAGMSVNAFAVRELSESAARADNPAIFDGLPDLGIDGATVAAAVDDARAER